MFRAIISPIFKRTSLCVTACGTMPAGSLEAKEGYRPATSWVNYTTSYNTQSSASEDGRDYRPKHAELIGIINKPLFFQLFGCLRVYYVYQ